MTRNGYFSGSTFEKSACAPDREERSRGGSVLYGGIVASAGAHLFFQKEKTACKHYQK
jgi:hypothetical protein